MKKQGDIRESGEGDHVSGTVTALDGRRLHGMLAVALAVNGREILELGSAPLDKGGTFHIGYPRPPGVLNLEVQVLAADGALLGRSRLVRNAPTKLTLDLALGQGGVLDPDDLFQVHVHVRSGAPLALAGLDVEVWDRRVGAEVRLASGQTDPAGRCALTFKRAALLADGRDRPDLIARVHAGGQALGSSALFVDAESGVQIPVRLAAGARDGMGSEMEHLLREVKPLAGGALEGLRENAERRDVTLLARKSGWDARLIAMSAAAERLSAQAAKLGHALGPEWFYALFRAGVPADPATLYRVSAADAQGIWSRAIEARIIPAAHEEKLAEAVDAFTALSAARLLAGPPPAGLSPIGELLRLSLGDDAGRHRRFADLHARHGKDPAQFWAAVEQEFPKEAQQLKVDGSLATLTLNNAPLVQTLRNRGRRAIRDTRELIAAGLHRGAAWKELLAGVEIPAEITGADDGERRARYAEVMAASLRLSFPTTALAAMVRDGDAMLRAADGSPAEAETVAAVASFLEAHQDELFLGVQPVEQYLRHRKIADVKPEVVRELKRLQRVHQLTPGDEAMTALLRENLDSAYAIVNYGRERFIGRFKDKLAGEAEAELVFAKAEQVHGAVLNVALAYVGSKTLPGIGVHSPPRIINPAPNVPNPNTTDVLAYAALEDLFGEMDYCECQHCRSVLSPAAYLVNLLQFLEPPGAANPSPQRVLLERRPDIQHLLLTCENTNTSLPQIDLVNETLEYFVAANSPAAAPVVALSLHGFTGYDTPPGSRTAELLASPAHVRDAAYRILESASFPVLLPLVQPLESLRRHFRKFETPLSRVMETLRTAEALERAGTIAQPGYGWRDVFLEELQISRAEAALLTDSTRPFAELFGHASATEAALLPRLAKAKDFSRRIGVSYVELVQVLGTQFVNPNAVLIPRLMRLGVPFITLKRLVDNAITDAQFRAAIAPQLDVSEYGGDVVAWVRNPANYQRIMGILTLVDPTASPDDTDLCNFDNLEFRYSLPDNAANSVRGIEYLRLLRFIRLWRRLGWPVELLDEAIVALYPADQLPNQPLEADNRTRLDAGFRVLLLRLGVVRRVLTELELDVKRDLPDLLACFAPMGTSGPASLYRRLFGGTEFLRQHPQFADDGYGNFLGDPAGRLLNEREALRGALQLTDEEFGLIAEALTFDGNTPLDVGNVTRVHRHGWLARKLRISVAELVALISHSGIDPFGAPDVGGDAATAVPAMLRFLRFVADLRQSNLKPGAAAYLLWNRDLAGNSSPAPQSIASFATRLRNDLAGVQAGMSVVLDPEGTVARERMALVYGAETTETFFGLLEGTLVTQVTYAHGAPQLDPAFLALAPDRMAYDDLRKQLSFKGVLTIGLRDTLRAGQAATLQNAIDGLYNANQRVVAPFFAAFPELRTAFDQYIASTAPLEQRRSELLASFLPILIRRRSRQVALQAMSIEVRSDVLFTASLLERPTQGVYPLHAAGDTARPGLDDLVAIGTPGLAARFFFAANTAGMPSLSSPAEKDLAYSPASHPLPANPAAAAAPVSGIWSGRLEAPESGFYNLRIEADAGASVTLRLAGAVVPMTATGNQWSNNAPIELTAGQLVAIELTVENTRTMIARWQTAARAWEIIPPRFLYTQPHLDALTAQYVRTFKAASLRTALELGVAELAHLASISATRIGGQGWLNALVVSGTTADAMRVPLYRALRSLLDYALLKQRFASGENELLEALRDPTASGPDGRNRLLAVTRWNATALSDLLSRLGLTQAQLASPANLRRVADAFTLLDRLGISAAALIAATTNQPDAAMVRAMQAALRARFSESDWLDVLKPINDELRTLQRDSLVAFILQRMSLDANTRHIDTPDRLFEYFLMDVQMEPCMQTSRVRHALSSVQLFVDRCLMGLEARVAPSALDAEQWKTMNRYRIWEANRKVFLYPENWLEPELRDDQSPIFREVMGELMQGDITEERAQIALLGYLAKLDEVAKLEPCGMCHEAGAPGTADDITHVVARTAGAGRKFFYRKREHGSWTPWEPIKLDIEDTPVTPIVWKGRLFLFWLRVMRGMPERAEAAAARPANSERLADTHPTDLQNQARAGSGAATKTRFNLVLCWSERFNGAWQPVRTSSITKPMVYTTTYEDWFDRSKLYLVAEDYKDSLLITIANSDWPASHSNQHFRLYNLHSEAVPGDPFFHKPLLGGPRRLFTTERGHLVAEYHYDYLPGHVLEPRVPPFSLEILATNLGPPRLVWPNNSSPDPWIDPFFVTDAQYSFFVTTERHDPPLLTVIPGLFGNYTLNVSLAVDGFAQIDDPGRNPALAARAAMLEHASTFVHFDPDPTDGQFLRHGLHTGNTWRYDDSQVGAGGAVIDRP